MNNKQKDIFDLSISDKEKKFVREGIRIEENVITEIIKMSEEIPYLSSLFNLAKMGYSILDLMFIRKLARFLKQSESISIEGKENFLNTLSPTQRQKMSEYLTHVLYSSEDEDKAEILGLIYKARLMNKITDEMMLRLIVVIGKIFVLDLKFIDMPRNTDDADDQMIIDNFKTCGLIFDMTGIWQDGPLERKEGSLSGLFNKVGDTLYKILKDAGWFNNEI